jgi:hypothetical protein
VSTKAEATDSPAAARPTRESVTALLDEYLTAFACWASTDREFEREEVGADILDQAVAERDAARAALDASLASLCEDAARWAFVREQVEFGPVELEALSLGSIVECYRGRKQTYGSVDATIDAIRATDAARSGLPRDGTEGSHA